jgi:endothelin-converting enzyme
MRQSYLSIVSALPLLPLGVLSHPTADNAANVCTTAKCQDLAKYLKESIAPNYETLDPCTNFDKYSCDGWIATHKYREEQTAVSVTTVMTDENNNLLHAILEGKYAENTTLTGSDKSFDEKNFNNLKNMYKTCMNIDAIKAYGITPLQKLVKEFNAIFPASRSGAADPDELTNTMIWLAKKAVVGVAGGLPQVSCAAPFHC